MTNPTAPRPFSIPQARSMVADLFEHRPARYWIDFWISLIVGYGAAIVFLNSELFTWYQVAAYFVAGFALFRLGSFIHEIVHMSGRTMLGFRVTWNLLAGVPMMMPSFFYGNHIDHHSAKHYGTAQDGEYLPLGTGLWKEIVGFYGQVVILPVAVFLRFLILTPISFLHPKLRQWTLEHASSFVINLKYKRHIPANAPRKWWAAMDILCSIRAWLIPSFVLAGAVPPHRLLQLYLLGLMALGLNYVRNLVAHRYQSDGIAMSYESQLSDSITIEGRSWITELFFPLGLRYHALHHVFATLPYHNLGKAHHRLMNQLPDDSQYHATVHRDFADAVLTLLKSNHEVAFSQRKRRSLKWRARRNRHLSVDS